MWPELKININFSVTFFFTGKGVDFCIMELSTKEYSAEEAKIRWKG